MDITEISKYKYFIHYKLKINSEEFLQILQFTHIFNKNYDNMLNRYTTFSKIETAKYWNEHQEADMLSYHLEIRGIKFDG